MSCYHPLHAYRGKSKDVQKTQIAFKRSESWRGEKIELPCGQCIGCRLDRAKMWATRCVHEASLYDENSFITLTYNDEHLPKDGSLCLKHFQDFMKRIRKENAPKKIRFFHCGEYGESFARPHYHALLFNHDFKDKKLFTRRNNIPIYTSESLSRLWPFGFNTIGEVNLESAGYVARYTLKKVTGIKQEEHYGSMVPEYATMSRRPGIGKEWFDRFSGDVYPADRVVINGTYTRPPRYYDDLYSRKNPSDLALVKIMRENNEQFVTDIYKGREILVSDSSDVRLIEKEKTKKGQIELLNRHKDGV